LQLGGEGLGGRSVAEVDDPRKPGAHAHRRGVGCQPRLQERTLDGVDDGAVAGRDEYDAKIHGQPLDLEGSSYS
jgi:hypothetical protein